MKKKTERMALMGLLLGVMLILGYVESLVPLPGYEVGIRLGLSNAVLLFALSMLGVKEAFLLMAGKVLLSGFLFSGLQAMMYSLGGGLLSLGAMLLVRRIPGVSLIGVSAAGAVMHMAGQILVALAIQPVVQLLYGLPVLMAVGLVTGVLTGIAAGLVIRSLKIPADRFKK